MRSIAVIRCAAALALLAAPSVALAQRATPAPLVVDTVILQPSEIGTITVGQSRRGMLEAGDYSMGDGTWADVWYVEGAAGQRLVITLRSSAFDSYLQLLDAAGGKVAEDDDSGGGGGAARITYPVRAAGRYQIVVNNYGDTPRSGVYTLELR
jgi:hypothetical protein